MALSELDLEKIRVAFNSCTRPVIIFDSDHDGLASFLLIYKHIKEGIGLPVKRSPDQWVPLARKVNDYAPDLVIIVDVAVVSQDFLDLMKCRVLWIDHHPVLARKKVEYFNPRIKDSDDNSPVSYWMYKVLQENLWISMCGMIGDWYMPEDKIRLEFLKEYPDLLPADMKKPQDALFKARIGEAVRIMNFNLKGKNSEVLKAVKVFTRINSPYEILDETTAGGKFLRKKYLRLEEEYRKVLNEANAYGKDKLAIFISSTNSGNSFTAEVSNALTYKYPEKLILSAWEYNGEYKISLRSGTYSIPEMLEKALEGVQGYGGGHKFACGACVKSSDFEQFVTNLRAQL